MSREPQVIATSLRIESLRHAAAGAPSPLLG
jgi:hypothetical protein